MIKWIRTAIHANRRRRRQELSTIVRQELGGVLHELPPAQLAVVGQALATVSDIPKELVLSAIRSAQTGVVVEFRFRDGSSMLIREEKAARGGPGW